MPLSMTFATEWAWLNWLLGRLVPTFLIIVAWILAVRFCRIALIRALERAGGLADAVDGRRRKTVSSLLSSALGYSIGAIAIVTILATFDVPVQGLLAGAGIVGLAIGFGAQNLVRDVITGFFLILEDYYAVDDYVTIGSTSGRVTAVGLRTTQLEDFSGAVHHIPNGQINQVTNNSRRDQRFLVEIKVAQGQDLDRITAVLEQVSEELRRDVSEVHEGPTVLGVTNFGPSDLTITIFGKAQPMSQWSVERQLRARIAAAFEQAGIKPPFTRHVIFTYPGAGTATKLPEALNFSANEAELEPGGDSR